MGVGASAGALQRVLGNTGTSGDGERRGVAGGGEEKEVDQRQNRKDSISSEA